jgi:hypothetical protein
MVEQPAYIQNLKKYAKIRLGGNDAGVNVDDVVRDLQDESDRGAIILAATGIEDMLEFEILKRLPNLEHDEPTRKRMFEQDGQLSSFSKKIEMAYAMGIIDKDYRKKIDLVREIRNACAHARMPLSLAKSVLRIPCEVVISDMLEDLIDHEPATIRNAFVAKSAFISHYIATGEKLEGMEAHLRHWASLDEDGTPKASR